jgi:D-alanine-D-alanine ligase-like ATP-grasp enzyme
VVAAVDGLVVGGRRRARPSGDPGLALATRIWMAAAGDVGATATDLGDGYVRLARRASTATVWRNETPLDDPVVLRLAADKTRTHALLRDAGVPVPEHEEFGLDRLPPLRGRVVVKPASGTAAGTGVTPGVSRPSDLRRAAVRAARWGSRLLLEEHVDGDVVRVLVLDGEAIAAVVKRPPHVEGDGRSSVGALIAAENERRAKEPGGHLLDVDVDLDCALTLRDAGLSLRSVPAAGQRVQVKRAVNQNARPENDVLQPVPQHLAALACQAAAAVGLRLAGVDLVTSDDRTVVLEVNGTPGLNHHELVAGAPDRTAAARVVDALLA